MRRRARFDGRLAIPLGSHQVQLRLTPVEELPAEESRIGQPRSRALLALGSGMRSALVISAALVWPYSRTRRLCAKVCSACILENIFRQRAAHPPDLRPRCSFHWVIGGGEEGHSLMFPRHRINDYGEHGKSPQVALFGQQFGHRSSRELHRYSDTFCGRCARSASSDHVL